MKKLMLLFASMILIGSSASAQFSGRSGVYGAGGGGGGGANPAGSAHEAQYRFNSTTFGAMGQSNWDSTNLVLSFNAGTVSSLVQNIGSGLWNPTVGGVNIVGNDTVNVLICSPPSGSSGIAVGPVATSQVTSGQGGNGYLVGDTFQFLGYGNSNDPIGVVDTAPGGVVATFHLTNNGVDYFVLTGLPTTTLTGSGTGLQVDVLSVTPNDAFDYAPFGETPSCSSPLSIPTNGADFLTTFFGISYPYVISDGLTLAWATGTGHTPGDGGTITLTAVGQPPSIYTPNLFAGSADFVYPVNMNNGFISPGGLYDGRGNLEGFNSLSFSWGGSIDGAGNLNNFNSLTLPNYPSGYTPGQTGWLGADRIFANHIEGVNDLSSGSSSLTLYGPGGGAYGTLVFGTGQTTLDANPGTAQGYAWTPNFDINTLGGTRLVGPVSLDSNFGSAVIHEQSDANSCSAYVGTGGCDFGTYSTDMQFNAWLAGSLTAATNGNYQIDFGGSYPAGLDCVATLTDFSSSWSTGATLRQIAPIGSGRDDTNSVAFHWDNAGVILPSVGGPSVGFNVICFTHGG